MKKTIIMLLGVMLLAFSFSYRQVYAATPASVFDIDGNGEVKSLSDGLLALRYLFGFRGATLVDNAIGKGATRKTATQIETYLNNNLSVFDIDGNGEVKPLSDGLLLLRYLFGFTGDSLINNAIGENANRVTADDIETYLQNLRTNKQEWKNESIRFIRSSNTSIVFKNKIWQIGGAWVNVGETWANTDDILSSPDGSNWEKVADTPWGARIGQTSVVFNNKIWVMGGRDPNNSYYNDIWSSLDGINWTKEVEHAPWFERAGHASVVFNNKIWVLGGQFNRSKVYSVWSSPDGINWTLADTPYPPQPDALWSGRDDFTSVVFKNKIWVMGGVDNSGNKKSDIWSSSDGENWEKVADAPWSRVSKFPTH